MEFHHLRTFDHLAKRGNFSRTAEELSLSQSAVSRHIEALENEFGLPLFTRHGRRTILTEAGRRLADFSERILRLGEEAAASLRELQDLEIGSLSLGASTTPGNYLLGPVLNRYQASHPSIHYSLQVSNSQTILRLLEEGKMDLAVLAAPNTVHPGFYLEPYLADRLILVAPPGHPATLTQPPLSSLTDQVFFLRELGSNTRQTVENHFRQTAFAPPQTIELGATEAIKGAVSSGAGLAFLPACAVESELADGRLTQIEGEDCLIPRRLVLAYHKDRRLSPAALAFAALLRKEVSALG